MIGDNFINANFLNRSISVSFYKYSSGLLLKNYQLTETDNSRFFHGYTQEEVEKYFKKLKKGIAIRAEQDGDSLLQLSIINYILFKQNFAFVASPAGAMAFVTVDGPTPFREGEINNFFSANDFSLSAKPVSEDKKNREYHVTNSWGTDMSITNQSHTYIGRYDSKKEVYYIIKL